MCIVLEQEGCKGLIEQECVGMGLMVGEGSVGKGRGLSWNVEMSCCEGVAQVVGKQC